MVMPNRVGMGLDWPNPKLGLGFMNPIWVERGQFGLKDCILGMLQLEEGPPLEQMITKLEKRWVI